MAFFEFAAIPPGRSARVVAGVIAQSGGFPAHAPSLDIVEHEHAARILAPLGPSAYRRVPCFPT